MQSINRYLILVINCQFKFYKNIHQPIQIMKLNFFTIWASILVLCLNQNVVFESNSWKIDGNDLWVFTYVPGIRISYTQIYFGKVYSEIPTVQISMVYFDVNHFANFRIQAYPYNISKTGFILVVKTWGETSINGL